MILDPGRLFGLPAGVPSAVWDLAWWRDLLVFVALAAALAEARARSGMTATLAALYGFLALAFWVAVLERPYGVMVDPVTTVWSADVAVTGWAGGTERFLAGEPGTGSAWTWLARHVRADLVILLPTVLPVLVAPVVVLVVAGLWSHPRSALAAALWMGGGTGALDALRGTGFLSGSWARPRAAVLWLIVVASVLVIGRLRLRWRWATGLGLVLIACWAALGRRPPDLGPGETLLALTLDHHLWLPAGLAGLGRARDPAACALALGGGLLVLLAGLGAPGDAWAGSAFLRLGLVLGATDALTALGPVIAPAPAAPRRVARLAGRLAVQWDRIPAAAVILIVLGGGFLTWWDPPRTDPIARESLEPVAPSLVEAMDEMREGTAREASVLAHADYAPAVAILGGRRVLRAPGLLTAPDEERRRRLENVVLAGRPPAALLERYGLRYVFLAPGQFKEAGIEAPEDLESRGHFRLLFGNDKGMRLYEIVE